MNHDKELDTILLRFFDGQLSLSQARSRIKQVTGRCFLDMGERPRLVIPGSTQIAKTAIGTRASRPKKQPKA